MSAMAQPTEPLADYLLSALADEQKTVSLAAYHVDESALHDLYSVLYATEPRLFFLSAEYSIRTNAEGYVTYLRPHYRLSGEARRQAEAEIDAHISTILSPIRTLTPLEQVAYLHDYLISRFSYDITLSSRDIYTMLTEGRGVCQAYTLLFLTLTRELGIPSHVVTCFDMSHEWNMVQLGGEWYHIDLVWDDTDVIGEVGHTFFLVGDEEMRFLRAARDMAWDTVYQWDAPAVSEGAKVKGAPWRTLISPFRFPSDGSVLFSCAGANYRIHSDLSCILYKRGGAL